MANEERVDAAERCAVHSRSFCAGIAVLLLCVGLAVPATAGTIWDRVTETNLPNGLKVLLVEEPKAPVVTVQIWYKAGARNEALGKGGLAHMMEHMMFKGTPKTGPKQFSIIVQRNGGQDNAHTARDAAAYYEDFAADRVNLALELEADRMVNVLFEEKEFLPERDVVYEERRLRIEDQPAVTLGEIMRAVAFLAHPYGRPTIGWPSEIKGWTLQDAMQFYKTYYAPNTATLIVAGDIKKDDVLKKVTDVFGPIPRGPAPPPQVVPEEPVQIGERRVFVRKEAELPILFAVHHVPNLTHPDSSALRVLAYILGGGESARLHQKVVYEQQLASYAGADYNPVFKDPFLFGFSAGPLPGKTAEEVERAVFAEVERVQKEPVTDRELQKAKNQIEAEFVFAQDSVSTLANLLGEYESAASWKLLTTYLDGIRKVTAADVQRVAQQYLIPDNRTVAILVPTKPGGGAPPTK
jgi:zinc protease